MGKEIDKAELSAKIRSIECIDNDTRAALLTLVNGQKKYGLVWEEHTEEVEEDLREKLPVLVEEKELFISSTDKDAPNHIIIEGDNLHALTALTYTHAGKIDVIYIDPPYNTGNKDFVYNDTFVGDDDAYRHSKWLSFMSKRLKIAKQLLSDKGVIFISIDDREQANLTLLCNSIFGENNLVETFFWESIFRPSGLSRTIRKNAEYVLLYKNNGIDLELIERKQEPQGEASLTQNNNKVRSLLFPKGYVNISLLDGTYEKGKYGDIEVLDDIVVKNGTSINDFRIAGKFKWSQEYLDEEISKGVYICIKTHTLIPYYRKDYQLTALRPTKIIPNDLVGDVLEAGAELKAIFGNQPFGYPKPTSLISFLERILVGYSNAKILDFFAGSGTTLHATMKLNKEDEGHRQCILVTNNENNICRDITYERNKRVIQGYTNSKGVNIPGLTANKLRYYRTDFVERQSSVTAKKQLMATATDMLCIKNDIYTECTHFNGKKFRMSDVRFFDEGDKQMLIIYNIDIIKDIASEISNMTVAKPIVVYVFSTNDYAYDADFADVQSKVNLCALPEAIYRAYLQVLPKRKLI